jgi:hypothetical protein
MLKLILKKLAKKIWTGFSRFIIWSNGSSMKDENFLEHVSDYWFLKKGCYGDYHMKSKAGAAICGPN